MSEYLFCCFYNYNDRASTSKYQVRRIDKSMIGLPTNFQHCSHIGCGDVSPSLPLTNLEDQMKSKGGILNSHGNSLLPTLGHLIDLKQS